MRQSIRYAPHHYHEAVEGRLRSSLSPKVPFPHTRCSAIVCHLHLQLPMYDRASYRGFVPRETSCRLIRMLDDSSPGCNVMSLIASGCRRGACRYSSIVEPWEIRTVIATAPSVSVSFSNGFQHCCHPSAGTHLQSWNFAISKFVIQPRQLRTRVTDGGRCRLTTDFAVITTLFQDDRIIAHQKKAR